MNKTWKLVVVALVITTAVCGQQRGGQRGGGHRGGGQHGAQQEPPAAPTTDEIEEMVSDLAKEILLSEEQEAKVLEIYKEHFEKVKSKLSSGRPDRVEMEALKEEFETAVKAVLTENQQNLFTAYQKNNSKREKPKRN